MSRGGRGGGTRPTTARLPALRLAGVSVVTLLLAGCLLSDPPPDPRVAPLEVVVESSKAPDQPCLLNRDEVAAGTHEVSVFAEGGTATVVIRDAGGGPVLELSVPGEPAPPASAEEDPPPEGAVMGVSDSVTLGAGEYVVECQTPAGVVGTAPLRVTPAQGDG